MKFLQQNAVISVIAFKEILHKLGKRIEYLIQTQQ